jgi:hypothetical protein
MKEELKKRKAVVMMPDVNMFARHLNTARHLNKLHRMESNNAIAGIVDLQEAPAKKLGCLSNKLKCLDFSATGLFPHRNVIFEIQYQCILPEEMLLLL